MQRFEVLHESPYSCIRNVMVIKLMVIIELVEQDGLHACIDLVDSLKYSVNRDNIRDGLNWNVALSSCV